MSILCIMCGICVMCVVCIMGSMCIIFTVCIICIMCLMVSSREGLLIRVRGGRLVFQGMVGVYTSMRTGWINVKEQ